MSQVKKSVEVKYTQAVMSESSVSMVLDPKFMGLLMQRFPDAKVNSLSIAVSSKGGDGMLLFHPTAQSCEERKMAIDGTSPEVFEGILQVVKDYLKG